MIEEEHQNYAKHSKADSSKSVSFKPKPTSQQELYIMIEDYLQSHVFLPCKPIQKRHLKWTKQERNHCYITKDLVSKTAISEPSLKTNLKTQMDPSLPFAGGLPTCDL